jgi:hypothetical protein
MHFLLRGPIAPAAIVLSWAGLVIHNAADLPARALIGPETLGPTAIYLAVAGAWFVKPGRLTGSLVLTWVLLQFVGGAILSVLPLPFLPYDPEQTLRHYSFHVVYGVTQLPLLVSSVRWARASRTRSYLD